MPFPIGFVGLVRCSQLQPHRHSPPSSLPLHPGSLRLQGTNAFVDEAEIQFHNGQMIYTYLCWTHDVWVRWKFSNFILKSAQQWQIQTPHSYHLKMQADEIRKFTGRALTLEMLTFHSRCTCSHVLDFSAMDGAIPKPSACRLMGPQKSLGCRHLAKHWDAKDGNSGNGFRCSQGGSDWNSKCWWRNSGSWTAAHTPPQVLQQCSGALQISQAISCSLLVRRKNMCRWSMNSEPSGSLSLSACSVFLSRPASVKTSLLDCNVTMCSFNCPVIFSGTVLARARLDDYSEALLPSNLHLEQRKRVLPFNLILDGLIINE